MKTLGFGLSVGSPNPYLSWKVLPAILDARAVLKVTQDPEVKAGLLAKTEAAAVRGVVGLPTFFVDETIFFGKERHGQVEEALCHARRDS